MASRDGRSAYSSKAFPSCSRLPSFSSPAACHDTCGRSIPLSPALSSPSPFSRCFSSSGLWSRGRGCMNTHSKRRHQRVSDISETVGQPGDCWRACLRPVSFSSSTSLDLVILTLPNATSLIYATWMDARRGLISAFHRVHDITRYPLNWKISLPRTTSSIRGTATKVGHQTIILFLRIDRALGNAKNRLAQRVRRFRRAGVLPIAVVDAHRQPPAHQNGPRLQIHVWNLKSIQRQNEDNTRCVCWVLRNITDPEAIGSAIRLAGTIRCFDGDLDLDPPFDLIVSALEACFDSTKRLYPGMRDRAYFSVRDILQINTGAKVQSRECASKYPIPVSPRVHPNTPTLIFTTFFAWSSSTLVLADAPSTSQGRAKTLTLTCYGCRAYL